MKLDLHFGLDWTALFDWRVLALTAGAGVVAGGLLGLVPAVQGTRADLGSALKTGSRGSDAPGPSGGATCWSSLKSPCRSCCSWAPGCS